MQQRCIDIITSVKNKLPEKNGHSHYHKSFSSSTSPIYFELFGLDFMIDQAMKLWLIEVNTNPCLAHECSRVLGKLIPKLLDNVFSIAVEPFMCPTKQADLPCQNNFIAIFS